MKRLQDLNSKIGQGNKQKEIIYSVPVTPKVKGESPIYRKLSHKDGLLKIPAEIDCLNTFWYSCLKKYENLPFLQDLTFKQVDQLSDRVGSWLRSRGHKIFFLYCLNSPNWTITDIASWKYGNINVPLYDTLGAQAFFYILKITQGTLMFTTKSLVENLYKFLSQNKYNLTQVCFFDDITPEQQKKIQSLGLKVSNIKEGLTYRRVLQKPKCTLQSQLTYGFTSGTTGVPKGVVYTHKMVISQCLAMVGHYQLEPKFVHMSYLPIAHSFQRYVTWTCVFYGVNIRYAKYPITQVLKDFATIKPHTIPIVPRLLNKFYPVLKALYEKEGNYNKIRAMFGGRLKIMVTGSAPVAPAILTFFKQALNIDIRQGYGQTQTTAASFITYAGDSNYGHVGGPNSATQFKLVDVPQMNYLTDTNPPKGQICNRGDSIFRKYFKDPKNTAQTVDSDGWNHSGDIGVILPNGALKIIDRKKNIFKLQQGEYIAPQKVQNVYARCKYVAQSFLYGDSLRNYNVAIVHPNLQYLPAIAKSLGIQQTDVKKLCQNKKITQFIQSEIQKQAKADGLFGFQQAKKIRLWHQPFQTVGVVTSTMKLQRFLARDKFKKELEQLYKQ